MQSYITIGRLPKKQAPIQASNIRTGDDANKVDEDYTEEIIEGNEYNVPESAQRSGQQGDYSRDSSYQFGLNGTCNKRPITLTPITYRTSRFAASASIRKFNIANYVTATYNETEGDYKDSKESDNNNATFGYSFDSNATL